MAGPRNGSRRSSRASSPTRGSAGGHNNGNLLANVTKAFEQGGTGNRRVLVGNIVDNKGNKAQVFAKADAPVLVVDKPAPKVVVHASFLIDASGSMAEAADKSGRTRMDLVLQHFKSIAGEILCPTDRLTVSLFNTRYDQLWHLAPAENVMRNFNHAKEEAQKMLGGGTQLWDSCLKSLASMQKTEKGVHIDKDDNHVLRFLVVFTDGHDNASTAKLQDVINEVRKPGIGSFQFLAVVAGADATAVQMREQFKAAKVYNSKVISASAADDVNLLKAFGNAAQEMRQAKTQLLEQLGIYIVHSKPNAKPIAPAMVQGLQKVARNAAAGGLLGGNSVQRAALPAAQQASTTEPARGRLASAQGQRAPQHQPKRSDSISRRPRGNKD